MYNSTEIISYKSVLSSPKNFLKSTLKELGGSWRLGQAFFIRDLKAQYRLSFLGLFWSIIPPLFFVIGFSIAANRNIIDFGETPIPYPAFAMVSIMIWHTFQGCIDAPIAAFKDAKPLIGRLRFSVESIFISKFFMVLFNFVIKLFLVLIALIYFNIPLQISAITAIFPLMALMVFGFFIGIFIAPLTLLIDDLAHALKFGLTFWMIATPVAYVVDAQSPHYTKMIWNPAASLISSTREALLSLPLQYESQLYIVSIVGLCGLFIFWLISKIALPFITERLGTS
ncbi:MAG: ABC transporter permease [Alphaproteobacteria bacterium]